MVVMEVVCAAERTSLLRKEWWLRGLTCFQIPIPSVVSDLADQVSAVEYNDVIFFAGGVVGVIEA